MTPQSADKVVSFLDSWLSYRAKHATDVIGFCVTIQHGSKTIFSQAYGAANTEASEPLTTKHLFHVASQTKMLTAIAILQLVQQKQLALDIPVIQYLPWLHKHSDKRFRRITIRQLLNHTAGLLRDGLESNYWLFKTPCPTKNQLRKNILASRLVFEPGKTVKYSNLAFVLLGEIIEQVSGELYSRFINDKILAPLGADSVFLDYSPRFASRIATGYGGVLYHKRPALSPRQPCQGLAAATGLYATTEDMCRIASSLFDENNLLLSDELKKEMRKTQSNMAIGYDAGTEFGLGLEIQTVSKRRIVGHSGHLGGHLTATFFDPVNHIVISAAGNTKDAPSLSIIRGIFGAIDYFSQLHTYQSDQANSFTVRLHNEISTVEIVQNGTHIIAIDPDDWEPFAWCEELKIIDDTTLKCTTNGSIYNHGELLQYNFKEGKVVSVRFAGATLYPVS